MHHSRIGSILLKITALSIFLCSQDIIIGNEIGLIGSNQWVPSKQAQFSTNTITADIPEDSLVGDLLSGLAKPIMLSPGIYQIRAVVLPKPVMNMGYRLILTVRDAKPTETTQYRPASSQLTPRPKEIWHAIAETRATDHNSKGEVTLTTELLVLKPHEYQISVGWKVGENNIGPNLPLAEAPASLKKLGLKSLAVTKVNRPVYLGKLKADRIVYKPGESPILTIPITYAGSNETAEMTYRVRMTHDVEPTAKVLENKIQLSKLKPQDLQITLPSINDFGGYRFDFDILHNGEVVANKNRVAICSKSFNRVALQGIPAGEYLSTSYGVNEKFISNALENMKNAYITAFEMGFWPPDNFQNLTPKKEIFFSAQMGLQSRSAILAICREAKTRGICVNSYLKGNYADGRDGIEWTQKYPELVLYHRDTSQPIGSYNIDQLINWDKYCQQAIKGNPRFTNNWHYICLDAGRPSIVDISAAETIASVKMFGWGGVRFDSDFDVPIPDLFNEAPARNIKGKQTATKFDADVTYANNIIRYKRLVRSKLPEFEFGFNHTFDDSHQKWIVAPAIASMGSIVMNETIKCFARSPHEAYNRWQDYATALVKYSRIVGAWGGYYQPIGAWGLRADDQLYQIVYTLAAQAKTFSSTFFDTPFMQRLSRFNARFAGILCSNLYPVPAPAGRIQVQSSAPLEWQNYVSYREPSLEKRDYVIHLINPPHSERAKSKDTRCLLRDPVKNVKLSIDLDPFEHVTEAWLLDPWDEKDRIKVPISHSPGSVTLTIPHDIRIWCTLVIRCQLDLER